MSDYCYCDQCTGNIDPPEPCQECWIVSGQYKICDGCCDDITESMWRLAVDGPNWQGRQLLHNGRKPR